MQLFTMYLSIIVAVGVLSTFISSKLQKELNDALELIKNGIETANIDKKSFDIKEFQEIADGTYKMLDKIKANSSELKELNESLEEKVELKTHTLEQKNQELENAKRNVELVVKAQDRFIKSAIHEINTPLAIIRANIELLELKGEKSKHLSKIGSAAKIIANIYDDLGYFVKKERYADKKIVIDFSSFVAERIEYFMEIAHFSNITLEGKLVSGLFVYFDQLQLQRIVDNNIYNAIKYSSEQNTVYIILTKTDEKVLFRTQNHSYQPIDAETIFDRFSRGENARGGFGIGLHLVHYICTKNGVDISVKNLEDGEVSFEYSFEDFLSSVDRMQGF
jgi:signal transduction histidine kinase